MTTDLDIEIQTKEEVEWNNLKEITEKRIMSASIQKILDKVLLETCEKELAKIKDSN
jgi:hypothetical protein